jgi:hypothetical protein
MIQIVIHHNTDSYTSYTVVYMSIYIYEYVYMCLNIHIYVYMYEHIRVEDITMSTILREKSIQVITDTYTHIHI